MKTSYEYAISLLTKRDYSVFKLKTKLSAREYQEDDIDETIHKLKKLNFLREEFYGASRVKGLLEKGYANSYIIQKCTQEQLDISDSDIDLVREEEKIFSDDVISNILSKKLRATTVPIEKNKKQKLKLKLSNYLSSKGYSFDEIQPHIDGIFNEYH